MDFGLVGVDGLVDMGQTQNQNATSSTSSSLEQHPSKCCGSNNNTNNGSGFMKQERSDPFSDEDARCSKMVKKAEDLGLRSNSNNNININNALLPKQQMLSFSSSTNKPQISFLCAKDVGLMSYFQQSPSSTNYNRGIRGPFTPAQWIELEHQAMIYKYLTANVPVPANLLIPIRKALSSSGFPGFSIGSYPAHSYGWGAFHLGFSGSTDPEPGRCRRTDGKKWRCSRDAVPDQKYCERHINRGRHRSRKPVEGLTGQAASGPTTNAKVVPVMSAPMSSIVTSNGGASNSVTIAHQNQVKPLHPTHASNDSIVNCFHDEQGRTVMPLTMNLKPSDGQFSVTKQHLPLDESSQSEFGVVSTDSLMNPAQKTAYLGCKTYNNPILEFNPQQTQDQYPLRHFMDVWPKPDALKSDWTQLSMSIPMSTSDFSSSSNLEKMTVSPLRLSREPDPSEMGLGVGTIVGETGMKQNAWIPITWGNSTGGPLGEVLNNTSNVTSLKGDGCDGSPQLGSSPTGVLQKSRFASLSNSSSAGSPRGGDILGSAAQASSAFIPSM